MAVATNLELSVFTWPVLYISNIGDVVEIVQAGQALVGYYGQGVWWQKVGAKKDEEVTPIDMISEGNKVFVRCSGKATGMDTIFGHYFEVTDDGKISAMTTYDDTLTAFNSMKK